MIEEVDVNNRDDSQNELSEFDCGFFFEIFAETQTKKEENLNCIIFIDDLHTNRERSLA